MNQIKSVSTLNPKQNLNQSVFSYSLFLFNCPLNYSQRGLVGSITFDSTQAEKGGVDPAELVGKVFVNAYHISSKPEDGLPASYGIAFTDGSRYHVRIHGRLVSGDSSRVAIDIDEDDLAGKQVTSASLLRYEGHFLNIYDFIGVRSHGLRAYVALGIKVEGTDSWIKFFGSEDDYNSDAGITVDDYCDVYLVKMKRGPVKKGRSKKY